VAIPVRAAPSARGRSDETSRGIIDGNYGGTFDVRFSRADTVIVLAPGRWRCLARVLRRALRNWGRAVQAEGCPERLDIEFLWWVWRFPIDTRPRLDAALTPHRDRLRVVELTSPTQVRTSSRRLALPREPEPGLRLHRRLAGGRERSHGLEPQRAGVSEQSPARTRQPDLQTVLARPG